MNRLRFLLVSRGLKPQGICFKVLWRNVKMKGVIKDKSMNFHTLAMTIGQNLNMIIKNDRCFNFISERKGKKK